MNTHHGLLWLGLAGICSLAQAQRADTEPAQAGTALIPGYTCQAAEYPAAARRKDAQGTVRLRFSAAPDGAISDVAVVKSAGDSREHRLLDLVSKRQIESCRPTESPPTLAPGSHEIELRWLMR